MPRTLMFPALVCCQTPFSTRYFLQPFSPLIVCGSTFCYAERNMHCKRNIYTDCRVGKTIRLDALNPCCSVASNVDSTSVQGIVLLISAPSAEGKAYAPI